MPTLGKGDIIYRSLDGITGFLYSHVGVYLGSRYVIHFTGTDKNKQTAKIKKTSLEEFAQGKDLEIRTSPVDENHSKAICDHARFILKNRGRRYDNNYNFVFNNCEDFAKECYEVEYNGISQTLPNPTQRAETVNVIIGTTTTGAVGRSLLVGRASTVAIATATSIAPVLAVIVGCALLGYSIGQLLEGE